MDFPFALPPKRNQRFFFCSTLTILTPSIETTKKPSKFGHLDSRPQKKPRLVKDPPSMTFEGILRTETTKNRFPSLDIFVFPTGKKVAHRCTMHCTTLEAFELQLSCFRCPFFLQKNGDVFSVMVKGHAGGLWSFRFMFLSLAF